MDDSIIPEDISQFIEQNIYSIAQWEALLLLHGSPDRKWSSKDIAQSLYIADAEAIRLLEELFSQGFVFKAVSQPVPVYQFQPNPAARERIIARLAALYVKYLLPVTHLIHSNSKNKIQKFADAFKIRKD